MAGTREEFLEQFQEVDAYKFEHFIAELWELQNWETIVTKGADDGGVDVIAEKSMPVPRKQVLQVKRYEPSNTVGRPDIQQYASIRQEQTDVDTVVVVTTGRFSDGAEEVGKRLNVKLIDGPQLYNLIQALDAVPLAHSYIGEGANQDETTPSDGEATRPDTSVESAKTVESPQLISEFDEETKPKDVPTFLPGLIKIRGEIINDLQVIWSDLDTAEEAVNEERYFDAVEHYEDINKQIIDVGRKIARYDAGLTNIDKNTTDHLPSTGSFTSQLSEVTERVKKHFRETFRITERAKGLELLLSEVSNHVDTILEHLEYGDQLRQNGEVEEAHLKYKQAKRGLEQASETMETYKRLVSEFDDEVIVSHQEPPTEFSLSELKAKVASRIESKDEYIDISKIADEAAGSFSTNVLTGNRGELFENELFEVVDDDEQLEFVFEPPRRGFRIVPPGEEQETPYHDATESGSCYLLITNQRILYVAGVDDHDETRSFSFDQISNVQTSTDATSPSLVLNSVEGEKYKFDGLRDHTCDLEAAASFIRTQLE